MRPDGLLEEVADAILDGRPVDWAGIGSRTQHTEKALLEQLKTLATVRSAGREPGSASRPAQEYWVIWACSSASAVAHSARFTAPGIRGWIVRWR
jgi:hypothetical protein